MPGGKRCSVANCNSNYKKSEGASENLRFFRFPRDIEIQREWIRKCRQENEWSCVNKRVCSKHFKSDDYEDAFKAEFLNIKPKQLKKDAIPSVFQLPLTEDNSMSSDPNVNPETCSSAPNPDQHVIKVPSYTKEAYHDDIKKRMNELEKENVHLKQKLKEKEDSETALKELIAELRETIRESELRFEEKVKLAFKDFLSPNQVEIALKRKTRARWTQDELAKGFTLRYLSKRAYIYFRETLHYPLPGLSTLQGWATNIRLTDGILEDILNVMDIVGRTKPDRFRATVLCYDEMKVASLYEYHQKNDEIFGPYSYIQVIMARGLFTQWKQPVFIGFDKKVTKQLLENVVVKLHHINYHVVACTSDCGGGNQGLWREMGISEEKSFTEHPVTKKPLYFFADVPHLLKLLRNWFLDTGFILEDMTVINRNPIKALIEATRSEINSCHKLTPLHISCEKTQRQNVKLAAELFSNSTATALKFYKPGCNKRAALKTGEFFQLVNNWFDIMNSYAPSCSIPTKKPYGTKMEEQNETLMNMMATVGKMLCVGKKGLQVFQKGIIMSIKSLMGLFSTMVQEYDVKYILTHRLNQDCLEKFFCQIRTRGGLHDHPSPLDAVYRIRMILLGKNPGLVTVNANTQESAEVDEDYLLASALKQATMRDLEVEKDYCIDNTLDTTITKISSFSSGSTDSLESKEEDSERDGLIYIAGFLAKKHKEKYPELGKYTYENQNSNLHDYTLPSFLQYLSFGGLLDPSEEWKAKVFKMDKYFQKFHKDSFIVKKNIVGKTTDYLSTKIADVPEELLKSFCKLGIIVRIKFLNKKQEQEKQKKDRHLKIRATEYLKK